MNAAIPDGPSATTPARVESIHVIGEKNGAPTPLLEVQAIAGRGLEGHHHTHKKSRDQTPRDLTLIEAEVIEELAVAYDIHLAPGESRRNLVTRGVRLNPLVGRHFKVGDVLCRGVELCEPCSHLDKLTQKKLLQPLLHRGGLRAEILFGGRISVGAPIVLLD